jgi:hypothetical protein
MRVSWAVVHVVAVALPAIVFGPHVHGDFVWDDVYLVDHNRELTAPGRLEDVDSHGEDFRATARADGKIVPGHALFSIGVPLLFIDPDAQDALRNERRRPTEGDRTARGRARSVRAVPREHLRARAMNRTRTESIATWIEELVSSGGRNAVGEWRADVDESCTGALHEYKVARGNGPSVVPDSNVRW